MKGEDLRTLPPGAPRGRAITIDLDGEPVRAHEGEPVAVALLAAGVRVLARSPKYHRPRGLFCARGHCGSCLMRIDGQPNVPACMVAARPDLRCERQNAFPDPEIDLLAAADWLFPGGMDHHRLMTGSRIGNELFVKLVRQMGGSGLLPDKPAPARPAPRDEALDVCIVGAGPAGLALAHALATARPGLGVTVFDDQPQPGGSLLAEPDGPARATALADACRAAGVRLVADATAIGVYRPEDAATVQPATALLAINTPEGLLRVRARRFVYATGAAEQNLPIPDNDRPGLLAARAVGRLAFLHGVAPRAPARVVLVHAGAERLAYLERLGAGLAARGVVTVACGADALAELRPRLDLRRDLVAMGALPAPASELPRQHGAAVRLEPARGGFAVLADHDGRASAGVFVAGDVTGYLGPEAAALAGARVGAALAHDVAASRAEP